MHVRLVIISYFNDENCAYAKMPLNTENISLKKQKQRKKPIALQSRCLNLLVCYFHNRVSQIVNDSLKLHYECSPPSSPHNRLLTVFTGAGRVGDSWLITVISAPALFDWLHSRLGF